MLKVLKMWIKIKKIKRYALAFAFYAVLCLPACFIANGFSFENFSWNGYFIGIIMLTYTAYIAEQMKIRKLNKKYAKKRR